MTFVFNTCDGLRDLGSASSNLWERGCCSRNCGLWACITKPWSVCVRCGAEQGFCVSGFWMFGLWKCLPFWELSPVSCPRAEGGVMCSEMVGRWPEPQLPKASRERNAIALELEEHTTRAVTCHLFTARRAEDRSERIS